MEKNYKLTREKHLDHMVKVVPLIAFGYAAQCYLIMGLGPGEMATNSLLFLGCCLVLMISGFVTYDLKHSVEFEETGIRIIFSPLGHEKTILYHSISSVSVSDSGQTFATVTITTKNGKKHSLYFVDDADKFKKWLEEKCSQDFSIAA